MDSEIRTHARIEQFQTHLKQFSLCLLGCIEETAVFARRFGSIISAEETLPEAVEITSTGKFGQRPYQRYVLFVFELIIFLFLIIKCRKFAKYV